MERLKQIITRLAIIVTILYTGYSLGQALWRNIAVNKRITELNGDIARIKQENTKLAGLIIYYQTDQFKELELRRRLGYKRPDEQVVVLPQNFYQDQVNPETRKKPKNDETPYYRKWLETITGIAI
ncbi:septum formation initiator family protein [Candidatus Berkelbacteria bacterium]|nr:septum formation initiator family protein [Candidatus Berkelbacteria bacterium]